MCLKYQVLQMTPPYIRRVFAYDLKIVHFVIVYGFFFFGFRPRFSSHFKEITLYEITLHVSSISSIRTIFKGPVSDSSL